MDDAKAKLVAADAVSSSDADEAPWQSRMGSLATRFWFSLPAIGVFWDGTIAYSLSKVWYDYFAIYVFNLAAVPFCDDEAECGDVDDDSRKQYLLAIGLFLFCAVINVIAKSLESRLPSLKSVPGVTAMATGAALGNALLTSRTEWLSENPSMCGKSSVADCTQIDLSLGFAYTLAGAAIVPCLFPLTTSIELGSGVVVDTLENWLETVARLLMKAISTSIMMLWNLVLTNWVELGIRRPEPPAGPGLLRVDAAATTLEGATSSDDVVAKELLESKRLEAVDMSHTHIFWAFTVTYAGSLIAAQAATAPFGRAWRLQLRFLTELSRLIQTSLGWVAGCAWTLVATDLWPPTYWDPAADAHGRITIAYNMLWASILTIVSAWYLLRTSVDPAHVFGGDPTKRKDVERSFLAGAMSFFVGWQWIIVARDVTASVLDGGLHAALVVNSLFSLCFFVGMEHWRRLNEWIDASRDQEEDDIRDQVEEEAVAAVAAVAQAAGAKQDALGA